MASNESSNKWSLFGNVVTPIVRTLFNGVVSKFSNSTSSTSSSSPSISVPKTDTPPPASNSNTVTPTPTPETPQNNTYDIDSLLASAQNNFGLGFKEGAPGTPVATAPAPTNDFKVDIPDTISSDAFASNVSTSDLFTRQKSLQDQYLQALQPSQELLNVKQQIRDLNLLEMKENERAENRLAPEFAIVGEQAAISRQASIKRQALTNQLEALVDEQSVKLEGLATALGFNMDNVELMKSLQSLTMPEILTTQFDEQTGEMFAFVRGADGSIDQVSMGRLSAPNAVDDFLGFRQNEATGQSYAVFQSGNAIISQPIEGTKGLKPTADERKGDDTLFTDVDGTQIDLGTVAGIKQVIQKYPDTTRADVYSLLDEETSLTATAIKSLLDEAGLPEEAPFLSTDYFESIFTTEQLKTSAKEAGFTAGGFLGFGVGDKGIEDYLNYLMGIVEAYRQAGYSDSEILKLMQ